MSRQFLFLSSALILLLATAVEAGDLRPPTYRLHPEATLAGWDFQTDQGLTLIKPDADMPLKRGDAWEPLSAQFPARAPYPSASTFGDVSYWPDHGGGYLGGARGDGGIVFTIPGWLKPAFSQRMRVQVTYFGPDPTIVVAAFEDMGEIAKSPKKVMPISQVPVADVSLQPGAYFFYEDWLITAPTPVWEQVIVFIPAETILLHTIIDTVQETHPLLGDIYGDGFEPGDATPPPSWLDLNPELKDIFKHGYEEESATPWPWPDPDRPSEGGNGGG